MARIIVCGYMIRHPVAGNLLAYLQYVLGLHRLGHEVLYLEESGWPRSCYNPEACNYSDDPSVGLRVVRTLMTNCGIKTPVCYVNRDSGKIQGAKWKDVKWMLRSADLLLNVGGVCWLPEFRLCRIRVLIDMDPFFTQVGRIGVGRLNEHHVHFSYGANIGRPGCGIPTVGIDWHPTVPPVVPELWQGPIPSLEGQKQSEIVDAPLTTIANWNAYGAVTHCGTQYGQKDEEFLRVLDLPKSTSQRLELAISGASVETLARLQAAGWLLRDGRDVSIDMSIYQSYIINSRGEFSAAKNAYVKTRSGWFSDRSVCYLVAGRPVILQDTGYSEWLPTGFGVFAFSSVEEAAYNIERVNRAYPAYCLAARELAEQTFSYKVVLPRLIKCAMNHSEAPSRDRLLTD